MTQYDEDGTIQIKGMEDNIINWGSENVSAFEIKKKLMEFSGVKDVAIFGVPDEVYGEAVATCIQFVEDLPYNAVAKFQKDKLSELMNIK